MQYCCASDKYFRGDKMDAVLAGWKSGAAALQSVFRKCEYDWRIVSILDSSHRMMIQARVTSQKGCNVIGVRHFFIF